MEHRSGSRVEAVDRAMILLSLLGERDSLGVTDAAAELGVVPSTAHRLLTTMAARGFVVQGPGRRYRAGPSLLGLRTGSDRGIPALIGALRPVLRALHDEFGETVHLMVLAGADVQFVSGIEADHAPRVGLSIGSRIPAYCTGGGKAILAGLPPGVVDTLHSGGLREWPGQRIRTLRELHAELTTVRARGYAVNVEESGAGVVAVGVAVDPGAGAGPGDDGAPSAAVSIAVPSARYGPGDEQRFARRLLAAREQMRELL